MKQLRPGDILDNFQIVEHVQSGGVANVYTAKDVVYQDIVVLKVPHEHILSQPSLLYHHQNETNISHHLDHPFIVRYLHRLKTHPYLILEYIDGTTLRQQIDERGTISLTETLMLCQQVAEALHYLHSQRVIHLDLKPDNILITQSNNVKIIDFGIARQLGTEDLLSKDFKEPEGSAYYISPEQLCGNRSCCQSDIYSFGIVVYEMLTGNLPYPKSTDLNELKQRLIKPPIPPRHHNHEIPPTVQEVILKALAADPRKRYKTATDFTDALAGYQSGPQTVLGRQTSRPVSLLSINQSSHHLDTINNTPFVPPPLQLRKSILGCIANSDNFQLIIEHLRREALINAAEITLLHVLEEDSSDHVTRARERAQENLNKRLEEAITTFNRYDLYPVIRLKTGDPADVILDTAREISCDLIVLGPPRTRKFFSMLFHGSVLEKVAGAGVANVTVATTKPISNLPQKPVDTVLTLQYVNELEIFLWDSWVTHLNSLADIPQALTGIIEKPHPHPLPSCPFSLLLERVQQLQIDEKLQHKLENCHIEFHLALDLMTRKNVQGHQDIVRNIYKYRAIPLSIEFKYLLMQLIMELRSAVATSHLPFAYE